MTPDQARAELARRELARRELARRSSQNPQVIEDSAQHGGMSKTPTQLERMGRNLTQKETRPLGLTPISGALSALGIAEEDIFPAVGQVAGGYLGSKVPLPASGTIGATTGAVGGQYVRQLVRKGLRGKIFDTNELGMEALRTGTIEGLMRGSGNFVFRRQIGNDQLKSLAKQLGQMKDDMIANPNLQAASQPILDIIETAYNSAPEPVKRGTQANAIRRWINYMKQKPNLSARDVIAMEKDLGEVAEFATNKKGFVQPAVVPNPAMNEIARSGRSEASKVVENLSSQAGQTGFGDISQKIHKLLTKYPDIDPTRTGTGFGTRLVAGGLMGSATQSPLVGIGTYAAMKASQSPALRNTLYSLTKKPAAKATGRTLKALMTESFRKKD